MVQPFRLVYLDARLNRSASPAFNSSVPSPCRAELAEFPAPVSWSFRILPFAAYAIEKARIVILAIYHGAPQWPRASKAPYNPMRRDASRPR
jgi:hypothetical protein